MKKSIVIAATLVAFALGGCSAPTPVSSQGPARFAPEMKTYAVLDHPVGKSLSTNHLFQQRIHDVMARRGFAPAPKDRADVLVSFKALTMPESGASTDGTRTETEENIAASMGAGGDSVRKVVLVTIEEAKTDRVVWVGWSSDEVSDDEVVTRTGQSLDKILAQIPPRG